jgi:hypothetical protein
MVTNPLHAAAAITRREQVLIARAAGYARPMDEPDKLGAIVAAASVFAEAGVAYALIGGLAVGIHTGIPRATLDVDFAIPTGVDRAQLAERFQARGFRLVGEFAHSLNFKHPNGEPVQLAFDAFFDPMIERAQMLRLGDLDLPIVTKADLISMKRRAASDPARRRSKALRDQADVALLEGDVPDPDEGW